MRGDRGGYGAKVYATHDYAWHCNHYRMTPREAMDKCCAIRARLRTLYPLRIITENNLDNPFMSEDARLVLINAYLRIAAVKRKCAGRRYEAQI